MTPRGVAGLNCSHVYGRNFCAPLCARRRTHAKPRTMGTRSLDGWLQRLAKTLSGGREMWQRRWFVLQGDTLYLYN